MPKTKTVPEPIVVTTICSECGLAWGLHGEDPTTDDCIRLLKAELTRQSLYLGQIPYIWPKPLTPWWGTNICQASGTSGSGLGTFSNTNAAQTPRALESSCRPVNA